MPNVASTPGERRDSAPITRAQPETILDSVVGFGRGVRDAVFGRDLNPQDVETLKESAKTDEHFARSIWWKGIRDQEVLKELATIAATHHPVTTAAYFNRLGIHDEHARIEIAKQIARTAGKAVGEFIDRFDIRSEKDRAEVAIVVATHNAIATFETIPNFKIRDERSRFEIALVAAKKNGEIFARGLKQFGITDNESLFELAKIMVNHHVESADGTPKPASYRSSRDIKSFRLTEEQLAVVARLAADFPRSDLPEFIDAYDITDQKLLVELATTSMERSALTTIENIYRFGITDPTARVELARMASRKDPSTLVSHFESFGIEDPVIRGELALVCARSSPIKVALEIERFRLEDPALLMQLAQRAMLTDPVQCLPSVINRFGLSKEQLNAEIIDAGFARIGGTYGATGNRAGASYLFGTYTGNFRRVLSTPRDLGVLGLDPDTAMSLEPHERMRAVVKYLETHVPQFDASLGAFLDEVQAEEVLPGALAATLLTWNVCDTGRYPNRGRAALARVTGYDLPTGKLSPNGAREMWGTLLTAHELLGGPPSVHLPVTFDDRPRALRFIMLGSSIVGLGGILPQYTEPVSSKQLDAEINRLGSILEETFAQQIGVTKLKAGSLDRLLQSWGGDVTPFSILAARFRHGHGWSRELPVLGSIAADVLDGTFFEKRYARTDKQLACLDDRKLAAWRENPSTLKVHTAAGEGPAHAASVRDNVRSVFESNLLMHLPEEVAAQVTPATHDTVVRFLALSERDRARERLTFADAVGILRTAIASSNDEQLKQTVAAINGLKQSLLRPIAEKEPGVARQITEDLNTLKELFRSRKGTEGQSYLVFSTITDDPKLLLMTGDLVQSSSCQNYRSGSMIGTLPGYVIDSNIKLALSYVIKQQQFDKARAQIGLEPGAPCRVDFDAARQTLILSKEGDTTGQTAEIQLGYALRREVLRLGAHAHSGKPVLLTERPYLQSHPIDQHIARQQSELIAAMRGAIGATIPSKLFTTKFPPSRNPGGVYSDQCGGTKVGPYEYRPIF